MEIQAIFENKKYFKIEIKTDNEIINATKISKFQFKYI